MDESRFDWGAIARVTAIIVVATTLYAFIVPVLGALAFANSGIDIPNVAGNEFYRWIYWMLAWGLTVWQGSWMIQHVHERIIDDMLVTAMVTAVLLVIVKIMVAFFYLPIDSELHVLPVLTPIDTGGALMLIVVALISARTNRY